MKYKTYSNPFLTALGLRFSKKLKKDEALILKLSNERNVRLSMMFVFFSITALWVDKNNIITHIEDLKPFTVSEKKKALYIVEMPLNKKYRIGQKFRK